MRTSVSIACGVVMISLGIVAVSYAQSQEGKITLQVKGANSMSTRINMLSRLYECANPNVHVIVEKGGTVDSGIAALLDKTADVAMASRRITDEEDQAALKKGAQLVERLVGYGAMVFIAHPSNRVNELTLDQVRQIFKGVVTNWKEVGGSNQPIQVLRIGEMHPGTMAFFCDEILGKECITIRAEAVPTFPATMRKVAVTPGAIGFVRLREAFELPVSTEVQVKVLKIRKTPSMEAVMPSRATAASGIYPARRSYYLYLTTSASDDAVKFVDFLVGKGWGSEG